MALNLECTNVRPPYVAAATRCSTRDPDALAERDAPAAALARGMMRRSWVACVCAAACGILLMEGGKARAETPACPSPKPLPVTDGVLGVRLHNLFA